MGLFKRPVHVSPPDPDLPLTTDGAAQLRILVRQAFAGAGVEVVALSDHVVDAQGRQFGLRDLAAACNPLPESDWPEVVTRHVANLLRPDGDMGGSIG
jgi:hypothetical protein